MINNKKQYKTKILIADDHSVIRRELVQIVNQNCDIVACSEAVVSEQVFCYSQRLAKKCSVNLEVAKQLTEAIRYVQSLMKNCIFGLTVLVNIRDSTVGSKAD